MSFVALQPDSQLSGTNANADRQAKELFNGDAPASMSQYGAGVRVDVRRPMSKVPGTSHVDVLGLRLGSGSEFSDHFTTTSCSQSTVNTKVDVLRDESY
jgi:hypothetical protein